MSGPTSSPTDPGTGPGPDAPADDPTDAWTGADPGPARLRRSTTDRRVAGVAGGIGTYFGVDPVLVRILFVLAAFAGGTGILAYVVAWVVMPEDDGTAPTVARSGEWGSDPARLIGIAALVLAAAVAFDGHWWGDGFLLPAALIGGGLWLLLPRSDPPAGGAGRGDAVAAPPPPAAALEPPPVPPPPRRPRAGLAPLRRRSRAPRSRATRVTVGLVALLAGALGVASAAGADLSLEAGLLACLAVTGVGLLVGAFTGGAPGLIGLAVPLLVALGLATAIDVPLRGGVGERHHAPETVAEVEDAYRLGLGELTLDLRGLDPEEVDARLPVEVTLGMGEVTVLVPDGVDIEVEAQASAGELELFGRRVDGAGVDLVERRPDAGGGDGTIALDIQVGLGAVRVR